jgi:hypothetical protein
MKEYHQNYIHLHREKMAGGFLPRKFSFRDLQPDDPNEWRPCDKLSPKERKVAFGTLQKFKKAAERARVQREAEQANADDFIDLEGFAEKVTPAAVEFNDGDQPARGRGQSALRQTRLASQPRNVDNPGAIKPEPIDPAHGDVQDNTGSGNGDGDEHMLVPAIKQEMKAFNFDFGAGSKDAPILIDIDMDDDEVIKLEEEERKLTSEIEEAERLREMKKMRDAMRAVLDAARSIKRTAA